MLIDSYCQAVSATSIELWQFIMEVIAKTKSNGITIAKDENILPFNKLTLKLIHAREIFNYIQSLIFKFITSNT